MAQLSRDGVEFDVLDEGSGDPALVFLHGWSCNRHQFEPQIAHFRDPYRVIAPDLRGFGVPDAPPGRYDIEQFADDLVWMCGELALVRPVLIGHSMGGMVATAAAQQVGAAAVVHLDSMLRTDDYVATMVMDFADALEGPDGDAALDAFLVAMCGPDDDPVIGDRIRADMRVAARHVMVSTIRAVGRWDGVERAATAGIPMLQIYSSAALFLLNEPLAKHVPDLTMALTVGSGHFLQLMVPEQVNPMIDRFLELLAAR